MTALPSLNSRFQTVDRPVAAPGKCGVCGATDRECVDFGMDIDDYGVFYLCFHCIREGALTTGLVVTVEEYDAERMKAGQSIHDYLNAHNMRVVTNEFASTVTGLVAGLPSAFPDLHVHLDNGDSASDDEQDGPERQELQSGTDESDSTAGQDDKPASKRRSTRVPADPKFEPLG